jgi:hypothetical protein|tara:strand:+ start:132 stop:569 length:438 start_codon:yes stop_codon:yes gene_type:complete
MITARLSTRSDPAGAGHFGAPRGDRTHKGQDYCCLPGAEILAPVPDGQVWSVSKWGYPYTDGYGGVNQVQTPIYRYVELKDLTGRRHRIFYVDPLVELNDLVTCKTVIGITQDVTLRYPQYPDMTPHVHYEVMLPDGSCIDPVMG